MYRASNGGFYPSLPVAAYQQTYVNRLRAYDRPANYRPRSGYASRATTSFKNYRINSEFVVKGTSPAAQARPGSSGRQALVAPAKAGAVEEAPVANGGAADAEPKWVRTGKDQFVLRKDIRPTTPLKAQSKTLQQKAWARPDSQWSRQRSRSR